MSRDFVCDFAIDRFGSVLRNLEAAVPLVSTTSRVIPSYGEFAVARFEIL